MDNVAYRGLLESIQHWKENEAAENFDQASVSADDCALCAIYLSNDCQGCPISEATGRLSCDSTPYQDAAYQFVVRDNWKGFLAAAKAMRIFLEELAK